MAQLPHPLRRLGHHGATANARAELDRAVARDAAVDALISRLASSGHLPVNAQPRTSRVA